MKVTVKNRTLHLKPVDIIGSGGEADVFSLSTKRVFKLFKDKDHLDFTNNPQAQQAATDKILEHQNKLKVFPSGLPPNVLVPKDLGYVGNNVVGYVMAKAPLDAEVLYRYSNKKLQRDNQSIIRALVCMYHTIKALHITGITIGDFNDLNILIDQNEAYFIDTDSFQFSKYKCMMFTQKFLDPLCSSTTNFTLTKPHTHASDWYAYSIMVMQTLLFLPGGPYGGVYRGKEQRQLNRITVFDTAKVMYPKPARSIDVLPASILDFFDKTFVKDVRDSFPIAALNGLRFIKCNKCGTEHAANTCPGCQTFQPTQVQTVQVRGKVTATILKDTIHKILYVKDPHTGVLMADEGGWTSSPKYVRFRIVGNISYGGDKGGMVWGSVGGAGFVTDTYRGNIPLFFESNDQLIVVRNGTIYNDTLHKAVGDVLINQTMIWINNGKGFGFYQAHTIANAFMFNPAKRGMSDVTIPRITGQLINANALFTKEHLWFFTQTQENGEMWYKTTIIDPRANTILREDKTKDPLYFEGAVTAGNNVFLPSDHGIIRLSISERKEFPDTEPFVNSDSKLLVAKGGLYVIDSHKIINLRI